MPCDAYNIPLASRFLVNIPSFEFEIYLINLHYNKHNHSIDNMQKICIRKTQPRNARRYFHSRTDIFRRFSYWRDWFLLKLYCAELINNPPNADRSELSLLTIAYRIATTYGKCFVFDVRHELTRTLYLKSIENTVCWTR